MRKFVELMVASFFSGCSLAAEAELAAFGEAPPELSVRHYSAPELTRAVA